MISAASASVVCPIHRQPEWEAEVANAALLEHGLGAVAASGNLEQGISRGTDCNSWEEGVQESMASTNMIWARPRPASPGQ
jgi:hypothetical protein